MKHVAAITVAAALGLLSVLGGTAAANGGSESATFCSVKAPNVDGGGVTINLYKHSVDPSQKGYATCAYARKVVGKVVADELREPRVVAGFRCTDFVLKIKPGINIYDCSFRGVDTATEIDLRFKVRYVPKPR